MLTAAIKPVDVISEKSETRWIALDYNNKKIAESSTPEGAINLAEQITKEYSLVFVPEKGATYIL